MNRSAAAIVRTSVRPLYLDRPVQREQHRRQVAVWVGLRDRAADRAAVSHLRSPIPAAASASTGQPRRTISDAATSSWRGERADDDLRRRRRRCPAGFEMPAMSISTSGAASRSFIIGTSE